MHVVIFEGTRWTTFAPLSLSRPVWNLASGMSSLLEKQIRHLAPTQLSLWVRPALAEYVRSRIAPKLGMPVTVNEPLDGGPALLVSGRALLLQKFEHINEPNVAVEDGLIQHAVVRDAAGLAPDDVLKRSERFRKILEQPQSPPQMRLVSYLWDLVKWNEESLIQDLATMRRPTAAMPKGAYHVIEPEQVWLGESVKLAPGVVLDASKGPVMVDSNASIGACAVLEGPCYVGPYAVVMPHTLIRPGSTIGTMCRVGGEISNSVMFGYSNKAHYGYLGDSYVGKWVNLGAGTTTSNLKNTYGQISSWTSDGPTNTGRRFLGSLIGDHAKTAILTRLMSGTYVGMASMVAMSSITPKFVPSFRFMTDKAQENYRVDKAIEVMKTVFGRRDRKWDSVDEQIVRYAAEAAAGIEAAG